MNQLHLRRQTIVRQQTLKTQQSVEDMDLSAGNSTIFLLGSFDPKIIVIGFQRFGFCSHKIRCKIDHYNILSLIIGSVECIQYNRVHGTCKFR